MYHGLSYLVIVHPPELDLPVVGTGDDERHGRVAGGPVHAAVVALQYVLHHCVRLRKGNILRKEILCKLNIVLVTYFLDV